MKVVIIPISKVPLAGKALMKVINTSEGSVETNYIHRNFVLENLCFSVKNAQLFAREIPQEEILTYSVS